MDMKKVYLIGLVVLINISNAFALDVPDNGKIWAKWVSCSADVECVAIHDACGGWTAANVQFKNEAERYQNKIETTVDCLSNTNLEPEPKVLCIDQICTVKPGGLGNAMKSI